MSLGTRIVIRALLTMALVLGGVALLTYQLVNVAGRDDVDRLLGDESTGLAVALTELITDGAGLDGKVTRPEATRAARRALVLHPSSASHVAVVQIGDTRLQSDGGPPAVAAIARGAEAPTVEPGTIRTVATAGGAIRVLDRSVADEAGVAVASVTVMAPLDDTREVAERVLRRASIAGLVGLLIGGSLLGLVVRRSLRPLREVSRSAAGISTDDLSVRVPVPKLGDEVAELATELNRMLERLEQDRASRQRFVAAISHEVRTPLAVAEGHLELLSDLGPDRPDDARRTATVVRQELLRLRRLLDDLMTMNRGGHHLAIQRETVFVPDLFDAIRDRAMALGLADRVSIDAPPPIAIVADQARLEQCVANLLQNAIDHNAQRTKVRVTSSATEDAVVIAVSDDGDGIDPRILPHVFEAFMSTRADGSSATAGLGLAVVRALVEAHGGEIELVSGTQGTVATISLPRPTLD